MIDDENRAERILILAPIGRDAKVARIILSTAGFACVVCDDIEDLCNEIQEGAGGILITEDAMTRHALHMLAKSLEVEDYWLNLPTTVLVSGDEWSEKSKVLAEALGHAADLKVLTRPIDQITLVTVLKSALQGRRQQYRIRALFDRIQSLNENLEQRVRDRTAELRLINAELEQEILERKRTEKALRESKGQLHDLSSRLVNSQEEERKRIARELHDSIGQILAAMKFTVENALQETNRGNPDVVYNLLESLVPSIQLAIEETRSMYMGLHPSILDDLGIIATVRWFCRSFRKTYPSHYIEVEIDAEEHKVPEVLKIIIFRVMQEALNNMAKHSRAELVNVSLVERESRIDLVIEDNGEGFDIQASLAPENPSRGLGLTSMRERVEFSGGTFSIESTIGEGTTIHASWPAAS